MNNEPSKSASPAAPPYVQRAVRFGFATFFVVAGMNHFFNPEWYLANQMPPWIPSPLFMLYFTGVAEILGGIGLLIPRVRTWAMWGLLALLVGVFPANMHMASQALALEGWSGMTIGSFLRLPLQAVFMVGVYWSSRD